MDGLGKPLQLDSLFVGSFHILLFVSFANNILVGLYHYLARGIQSDKNYLQANSLSDYGRIHSMLAFLAEIGILITTASLLFHVWNVVGWIFLCWSLAVLLGYYVYRFSLYFKPLLDIIRVILKKLSEPTPQKEERGG